MSRTPDEQREYLIGYQRQHEKFDRETGGPAAAETRESYLSAELNQVFVQQMIAAIAGGGAVDPFTSVMDKILMQQAASIAGVAPKGGGAA